MAKELSKTDDLSLIIREQVPKLTKDDARKIVGVVTSKISIRSAPYPSPDEYERYHVIDPDLTRQMKEMVLKEQTHVQELDKRTLTLEYNLRKRGQVLAFSVFVAVVALGGYTIYTGFELGGTIITTLGVGGIVAQFLKKR